MSFQDISAMVKKLEADGKRDPLQDTYDYSIKSKSKTTQAIKQFSEFKSPVDVIIALDLPANQVRAIYQEYLELEGFYRLLLNRLHTHRLVDHYFSKWQISIRSLIPQEIQLTHTVSGYSMHSLRTV
jgi:hypothetical protein